MVAVRLRTAVEKPESEMPVNDAGPPALQRRMREDCPSPVRGFAVLSPNSKGC